MYERKDYANVVGISPVKKSDEDDTVLLTLQVAGGRFVRLAISSDIGRHLGTQLLLLAGPSP